jgi:hypothetical protein
VDDSQPVTQTDALGGAGSVFPAVQAIAVNGLSRAVDGYLSTKYPLTAFNEPYAAEGYGAFEPGGTLVPRGAPGWTSGYGVRPGFAAPTGLFVNPVFLGISALLLVAVIVIASSK